MRKIVILHLSSENVLLLLDSAIGGTLEHSSSPKAVGGKMLVKWSENMTVFTQLTSKTSHLK